jgi:hypothetical protein
MKKFLAFLVLAFALSSIDAAEPRARVARSAAQPAAVSAPQSGTKVSARAGTTSVIKSTNTQTAKSTAASFQSGDQCSASWSQCMDNFCMGDKTQGRCICDDSHAKFDSQMARLEQSDAATMRSAEKTIEDLSDNGRASNIAAARAVAPPPATSLKIGFDNSDPFVMQNIDDISKKTGYEKYMAAQNLCGPRLNASCPDLTIAKTLYAQQIRNDCKSYETAVASRRIKSEQMQGVAQRQVRAAALETFNTINRMDRGECLASFYQCMKSEDACGDNWSGCIGRGRGIDIKRPVCEHVLNECQLVRDEIWPAFVKIANPEIALASTKIESNSAQSCVSEVSNCMVKKCESDIAATGKATMDACLSRPEMVETFCKVEIDKCTDRVPGLLDFVRRKLAAMRADACTDEVRACFARDTACGADLTGCLGLDYETMHRFCPLDKLVVCKKANPKFAMADLDNTIMGIYLALDNSALNQCQEIMNARVVDFCGGMSYCNGLFDDDKFLGAGSAQKDRNGDKVMATGLITWSAVELSDGAEWTSCVLRGDADCDKYAKPGDLDIKKYMADFDRVNKGKWGADAARTRVENELILTNKRIQEGFAQLANDEKLKYCTTGRDLGQITGKNEKTTGRFPTLLNPARQLVARTAITHAQNNYGQKLESVKKEIIKESSDLVAQFQCNMKPIQFENALKGAGIQFAQPLVWPQFSSINPSEFQEDPYSYGVVVAQNMSVEEVAKLSGQRSKNEIGDDDMKQAWDAWVAWQPETRNCKACYETQKCERKVVGGEKAKKRAEKARLAQKYLTSIAIGCGIGLAVGVAATAITGAVGAVGVASGAAIGASAALQSGMVASLATTASVASAAAGTAAISSVAASFVSAGAAAPIAAGVSLGVGAAAGIGASAGVAYGQKTVGSNIGVMMAGTVAMTACGAMTLAGPWGYLAAGIVASAAATGAAIASAFTTINYESACDIQKECQDIPM